MNFTQALLISMTALFIYSAIQTAHVHLLKNEVRDIDGKLMNCQSQISSYKEISRIQLEKTESIQKKMNDEHEKYKKSLSKTTQEVFKINILPVAKDCLGAVKWGASETAKIAKAFNGSSG
jgi:hypothetical protein